jgi:tRNA1Val (adenine37-N6)-methyltransferase
MSNSFFQFKQFIIRQDRCAMKVTTDACLFGALTPTLSRSGEGGERVLDIGTGTGLLSLMFAQKNSNSIIDAIEIDDEAFQQANENIAASPFADRIHAILGDARSFSFDKKYDLIISNPPFYENELRSEKKNKNVAHHGEELSFRELFVVIKNNLSDEGSFFLLLPYKRYNEIREILFELGLAITQLIFIRQSIKHDYFRIILEGKLKLDGRESGLNEISIWDEQQQYTEEFTVLLKDYYLGLTSHPPLQ